MPCGGTNTDPPGRLKIKAVQRTIDGVGGILGEAGPYRAWNDCPGISIEGEMVFDIDDIAELSPLELELLYLHEMGHVIGIGSVPIKRILDRILPVSSCLWDCAKQGEC